MKKIILMMLMVMSILSVFAQVKEIDWKTNVEEAIELAKENDQHVFIHFTGSDWCKWCIKLKEEVYDKDEFISYANENLVMVKLDFPRSIPQTEEVKAYNQMQAQKYGIRGFPTVILLDKEGRVVGQTGYQYGGPAKYVEHLKGFFKE